MISKLHPDPGLKFADLEEELKELEYQVTHKGEYTKEIHAERLNTIFSLLVEHECLPREICPAAYSFDAKENPEESWDNMPCFVCAEAVGVTSLSRITNKPKCPCHALGVGEAIIRTKIFLKEMGYV